MIFVHPPCLQDKLMTLPINSHDPFHNGHGHGVNEGKALEPTSIHVRSRGHTLRRSHGVVSQTCVSQTSLDLSRCGSFFFFEYAAHVSSCVTWLIHMCDVTPSYVWRDSFICVTWLIHIYDMAHLYTCIHMYDATRVHGVHVSFFCVTWLSHVCDLTHSYAWHDLFMCFTWLIHMCDMPHSFLWRASFIRVTWLIHACDMAHSHM